MSEACAGSRSVIQRFDVPGGLQIRRFQEKTCGSTGSAPYFCALTGIPRGVRGLVSAVPLGLLGEKRSTVGVAGNRSRTSSKRWLRTFGSALAYSRVSRLRGWRSSLVSADPQRSEVDMRKALVVGLLGAVSSSVSARSHSLTAGCNKSLTSCITAQYARRGTFSSRTPGRSTRLVCEGTHVRGTQ